MSVKQEWGVRIKVLIITALIASLGNVLATWKDVRDGVEGASIVMPWETLSVMVVMLVIVVVGCEVDDLLRKINIKLLDIKFICSYPNLFIWSKSYFDLTMRDSWVFQQNFHCGHNFSDPSFIVRT